MLVPNVSEAKNFPTVVEGVWCIFGEWDDTIRTFSELIKHPKLQVLRVLPPSPVPVTHSYGIDTLSLKSIDSVEDAVIWLRKNAKYPFLRAVSFFDVGTPLANTLNKILLPNVSIRADTTNKFNLYSLFRQTGIPTVNFHKVSNEKEFDALVSKSSFTQGKYIIKPYSGTGSGGVIRSLPNESANQTWHRYRASCENTRLRHEYIIDDFALVMDYIHYNGTPIEITFDAVVRSGKIVASTIGEKFYMSQYEPYFDRMILSPPLSIEILNRSQEIENIAGDIAKQDWFRDSTVHFEFRLSEDKCIPIDCANRPGGGLIPHAFFLRTGLDLRLEHIRLQVGGSPTGALVDTVQKVTTCIGAIYIKSTEEYSLIATQMDKLQDDQRVFATFLHPESEIKANPVATDDAIGAVGICTFDTLEAVEMYERLTKLSR